MHRTRVAATLVAVAILLAAPIGQGPVAAAQTGDDVPVAHIEGRGHGHGVGMSQWGAYTMANQGKSAADIIAAFYPGTELGEAGGQVVVGIDRRDRVRVNFPQGGQVRASRAGDAEPAGFPIEVAPGETVELIRDGAGYHVRGGQVTGLSSAGATRYSQDCLLVFCPPPEEDPEPNQPDEPDETTTTQPPADSGSGGGGGGTPPPPSGGEPAPTSPPSSSAPAPPRADSPLWAMPALGGTVRSVDRDRTYRGVFEFVGAPGAARLRNHVGIEDYVAGMAEVPGSWPAAAVQAQAIAARTYALRTMAASGEICDTESCQVYKGIAYESAGQRAAVQATAGKVVLHGGSYAATFYSASGGGHSATPAEGFGSSAQIPYLQAREYPTSNPKEWSVDVALTDVAARLGYPGTLTDVRVDETGPSGRALGMTLVGDAGEQAVDPQDFRRRLGLQSTLFTVRTSTSEEPPPPPPEPGEDRGVVGAAATPVDPATSGPRVSRVATATPTAATAFTPPSTPGPPLLLVLAALGLLVTTWFATVHHVTDRRRLHPLFALGTTVLDLSAVIGAAGLRSTRRRIGAAAATLSAWRTSRG